MSRRKEKKGSKEDKDSRKPDDTGRHSTSEAEKTSGGLEHDGKSKRVEDSKWTPELVRAAFQI